MKRFTALVVLFLLSYSMEMSAQTVPGPAAPEMPTPPTLPVPPDNPAQTGTPADTEPTPGEPAGEDDTTAGSGETTPTAETEPSGYYRVSEIRNFELRVRQGQDDFENAGRIVDLILDPDGAVSEYLVDLNNVDDYRSGMYLVSANGIRLLDESAELDIQTRNPSLTYIRDTKLIRQYYDENSVQASRLLQYTVIGNDSRQLGDFSDIVINTVENIVSYIVLVDSGFLGLGAVYHAVPFDVIDLNNSNETAVLPVNDDQLAAFSGFDNDFWPVISDPDWEDYRRPPENTGPQ